MNENLISIESYIQKINYWLPYPKTKKGKVLKRLKTEILEAIQDTGEKNPVLAFGDPYQVAKDISSGEDWEMERASYSDRFMTFIFDTIIQIIGTLVGTFIWIRTVLGPAYITGDLSRNQITIALVTLFFFLVPYVLLWSLGYFIFFEKVTSRTPGKTLLGLMVCDESGVRITWSQAIIRNLTKFNGISILLLFEVIIGKQQKTDYQRPLDTVAKTIVIRKRFRNLTRG